MRKKAFVFLWWSYMHTSSIFICITNVYMWLIVYILSLNFTVWSQKVATKRTSLRVLQIFLFQVWRDFPVGKDTCPSIRTGFRFSGPSHIRTPIIGSWGPGEKVEAHRPSSPESSTSRGNKPGSHRVGWAMLSSWICFVGFTAPSSILLSVSSQHRSVGKSVPVTSCICYLPVLWLLERQPLDCHLRMSTALTTEIASGEATLPGLGWSHCLGRRSCLQTPSQEDMEPWLPVESALELSVFYGNILGVNHVFVDVPCPSHTVGGRSSLMSP